MKIKYFNKGTLWDLVLMDDTRVADFLSNLPEEKRKLAEIIRRTVLQADKKVEETI
ncbi:MAG: hypothetical protein ACREAS_05375 [Nitrososphaera sp.]